MFIDQIKAQDIKKRKNAITLIDRYSTANLSEIKQMCEANNLNFHEVIYNNSVIDSIWRDNNLYNARPYKDLIKYVMNQETPPVILIDGDVRLIPECIMSSSIFGALEMMELVEIYTYTREKNEKQLALITRSVFDLLTDATWQLRIIQSLFKKIKKEKDRKYQVIKF